MYYFNTVDIGQFPHIWWALCKPLVVSYYILSISVPFEHYNTAEFIQGHKFNCHKMTVWQHEVPLRQAHHSIYAWNTFESSYTSWQLIILALPFFKCSPGYNIYSVLAAWVACVNAVMKVNGAYTQLSVLFAIKESTGVQGWDVASYSYNIKIYRRYIVTMPVQQ